MTVLIRHLNSGFNLSLPLSCNIRFTGEVTRRTRYLKLDGRCCIIKGIVTGLAALLLMKGLCQGGFYSKKDYHGHLIPKRSSDFDCLLHFATLLQ